MRPSLRASALLAAALLILAALPLASAQEQYDVDVRFPAVDRLEVVLEARVEGEDAETSRGFADEDGNGEVSQEEADAFAAFFSNEDHNESAILGEATWGGQSPTGFEYADPEFEGLVGPVDQTEPLVFRYRETAVFDGLEAQSTMELYLPDGDGDDTDSPDSRVVFHAAPGYKISTYDANDTGTIEADGARLVFTGASFEGNLTVTMTRTGGDAGAPMAVFVLAVVFVGAWAAGRRR